MIIVALTLGHLGSSDRPITILPGFILVHLIIRLLMGESDATNEISYVKALKLKIMVLSTYLQINVV